MPKIEKLKWDILDDFLTLWRRYTNGLLAIDVSKRFFLGSDEFLPLKQTFSMERTYETHIQYRVKSPITDMDIDRTRIWGIHWIPIFRHWYDILESILGALIFSVVNIVNQTIRGIDLSQAPYRFMDMAVLVIIWKCFGNVLA